MQPDWLGWARRLAAIAQNGLTYSENLYDLERYRQIRQVAAEMLAAQTQEDVSRILELFEREDGYATPKVDARAAVFRDGQILLVQEREDGGWTLPGGWVDVGEAPSQAIVREVYEESGYETRAVKLLAVWDRDCQGHPPIRHHVYKLFFLCELVGGAAVTSLETEAVGFFSQDAVPPLSLTRVLPSQIDRMFEHYRHPEWATEFD